MTLATTTKRGTTPMTNAVSRNVSTGARSETASTFESARGVFSSPSADGAPVVKHSSRATRTISAKMGESLFIVEYDGSVPLALPDNWPFPDWEVRRKLPMRECMECRSDLYEGVRIRKALRTSWVFRKRGEFYWHRICWAHMKPTMRDVIREMYSR